jgi:hypothetical protein
VQILLPTPLQGLSRLVQPGPQERNAAARKSHIKRTWKKLQKKGIYLKDLIRCKWP